MRLVEILGLPVTMTMTLLLVNNLS